jgi:hypothetical protein
LTLALELRIQIEPAVKGNFGFHLVVDGAGSNITLRDSCALRELMRRIRRDLTLIAVWITSLLTNLCLIAARE